MLAIDRTAALEQAHGVADLEAAFAAARGHQRAFLRAAGHLQLAEVQAVQHAHAGLLERAEVEVAELLAKDPRHRLARVLAGVARRLEQSDIFGGRWRDDTGSPDVRRLLLLVLLLFTLLAAEHHAAVLERQVARSAERLLHLERRGATFGLRLERDLQLVRLAPGGHEERLAAVVEALLVVDGQAVDQLGDGEIVGSPFARLHAGQQLAGDQRGLALLQHFAGDLGDGRVLLLAIVVAAFAIALAADAAQVLCVRFGVPLRGAIRSQRLFGVGLDHAGGGERFRIFRQHPIGQREGVTHGDLQLAIAGALGHRREARQHGDLGRLSHVRQQTFVHCTLRDVRRVERHARLFEDAERRFIECHDISK